MDLSVSPPKPPVSRGWGVASENSRESGNLRDKGTFYTRQHSFGREDRSLPSDLGKDDYEFPPSKNDRPAYNRAEQRSVVASNLSDRTTHKDLINVIRGGALLDIYLRTNDRSASISFIEGSAAQNFMNHVKRNDIYIHGKRVSYPNHEVNFTDENEG